MSELLQRTEKYTALAQARLATMLDGITPDALGEPMRYSVIAGGKRLRPCLAMACCEMLNGCFDAALELGCCVELIHTYSLIHDDLPCMDNDDYRRGRPSNHKVYGEAFALLAGDGLLSLAFELMLCGADKYARLPNYTKAMQAIARGSGVFGMVAGQAMDLSLEGKLTSDADTLKLMHTCKTGAIIKAALLAGAYTAEPDLNAVAAITTYAEEFGILFQITDDILDVTGDFASMGKTLGKDAEHDKTTYVTLYGLAEAQRLAKRSADCAAAALDSFGQNAEYLKQLASYTLNRRK